MDALDSKFSSKRSVGSNPATRTTFVRPTREATSPAIGDGALARSITMTTAFAEMHDALWLKRALPNADLCSPSKNGEVRPEL